METITREMIDEAAAKVRATLTIPEPGRFAALIALLYLEVKEGSSEHYIARMIQRMNEEFPENGEAVNMLSRELGSPQEDI